MQKPTAEEIIKLYDLQPLPDEGGHYYETYRSEIKSMPEGFNGERHFSTAIYFLLPQGEKSLFHRIKSDEVFHFYLGGPMTLHEIHEDGSLKTVTLGQNIMAGEVTQHVVKAGCWFGGYPSPETEYSLVGCTVSPGFEFEDFDLGQKEDLLRQFPQHKQIIEDLT